MRTGSTHRFVSFIYQRFYQLLAALILLPVLAACGADNSGNNAASASPGYKRINQPNPNDPLDAHIFELDNGLRVYLTRNDQEPRFYAEIAVRAGSKQDPADATGLAHYLEHLLFKGNRELGTLDYEAERPYLEQIQDLYEQHFRETDPARRAEIYAEINRVSQQA